MYRLNLLSLIVILSMSEVHRILLQFILYDLPAILHFIVSVIVLLVRFLMLQRTLSITCDTYRFMVTSSHLIERYAASYFRIFLHTDLPPGRVCLEETLIVGEDSVLYEPICYILLDSNIHTW